MNIEKYIIYTRVSTKTQGNSGLGLDAQLNTCREYVNKQNGIIIGEYSDVQSGASRKRKGLNEALEVAKINDATIVFATLDRLARDAEYSHKIKNSGVNLYFCDLPDINTITFGLLVLVAEYERELGRKRTTAAMNQIKKEIAEDGYYITNAGERIERLGNPNIADIAHEGGQAAGEAHTRRKKENFAWRQASQQANEKRNMGWTFQEITDYLNNNNFPKRDGSNWSISGVRKLIVG